MIKEDLLSKIVQIQKEQRMVVVHCSYTFEEEMVFQLAPEVILYDHDSSHVSQMLYREGDEVISSDKYLQIGEEIRFTGYFEPLPESCKIFTLSERTMERFALAGIEIHRQLNDEYIVELEMTPF
jgi:hypothetical protein